MVPDHGFARVGTMQVQAIMPPLSFFSSKCRKAQTQRILKGGEQGKKQIFVSDFFGCFFALYASRHPRFETSAKCGYGPLGSGGSPISQLQIVIATVFEAQQTHAT